MKIEPGMRFTGNVNDCKVEIEKANEKSVTYREIKTGKRFSVGRAMFEHLDLRRDERR